ncbi:MAG TPA: hypothetical protein VGC55_12945 [Dokdonella sp.]
MTSLEFIGRMTRSSLIFLQEIEASPRPGGQIKLRCPLCTAESAIERALPIDSRLVCAQCGQESEYRQLREAWCLSRRAHLERFCPEIVFPPSH